MDKKASRLRGFPRDGDDTHIFNLYIGNKLFNDLKVQCVIEGLTIREKLIDLVKQYLHKSSLS